jgi:hypothetical protein
MSNTVVIADWVKRIADEERKRDAVRLGEKQEADRKAGLIRLHGQRIVAELVATVQRDVESFRHEFPDDPAREIVLDSTPDGGFRVRKTASPSVSLTVEPHVDAGTIACHYRITPGDGLPPRDDRFELTFADGGGALQMRHHGTGRSFATADALSEFLLVPVLTGRPR